MSRGSLPFSPNYGTSLMYSDRSVMSQVPVDGKGCGEVRAQVYQAVFEVRFEGRHFGGLHH
jgi:hypothetical protein